MQPLPIRFYCVVLNQLGTRKILPIIIIIIIIVVIIASLANTRPLQVVFCGQALLKKCSLIFVLFLWNIRILIFLQNALCENFKCNLLSLSWRLRRNISVNTNFFPHAISRKRNSFAHIINYRSTNIGKSIIGLFYFRDRLTDTTFLTFGIISYMKFRRDDFSGLTPM
jgi:hypothetical protein